MTVFVGLEYSMFARGYTYTIFLGNFAPPGAPQEPKMGYMRVCNSYGDLIIIIYAWPVRLPIRQARWPRIGSACVDKRPSPKTDILVFFFFLK